MRKVINPTSEEWYQAFKKVWLMDKDTPAVEWFEPDPIYRTEEFRGANWDFGRAEGKTSCEPETTELK